VGSGQEPEAPRFARVGDLPALLRAGDVVVVNDAATLPSSIAATTSDGEPVEVRLLAEDGDTLCFTAALLGRGDHRTRTEDRPPPPRLDEGARLVAIREPELVASVVAVSSFSPRAVTVRLALAGRPDAPRADVWRALYRAGRPVQYAYVEQPLALWDVQNAWASRPWAFEVPSAGLSLRAGTVLALRRARIAVASVTHAAGISSTGDPAIDARLPLPERWHVPHETVRAVLDAKRSGGRVVAIGTSVVRALETAARGGALEAGEGVTDLRLGPGSRLRVVDAILTGVHEEETSHFTLLRAFASRERLGAALEAAERAGLLGHEFGDAWLVWKDARDARAGWDA